MFASSLTHGPVAGGVRGKPVLILPVLQKRVIPVEVVPAVSLLPLLRPG